MVASRATIECFLYMDLSPSSSHEVKSSCYSVWMLANIAKKLGTIAKTACLCSRAQSGSRPHQGRWSWQGGVRVAAALRGPGALPRPGEVAEGLQPPPSRPSGQVQDSGDRRHWVLYHEHRIWPHGQVLLGNAGGLQWPLVAVDSLLQSHGCPRPFQSNPACIFMCVIFIFKLHRGYRYPPLLSLHTKPWFIDLIFKVLFVKLSLSNFCHWITLTNIEIIISTQPLLVWAFHSSLHGHLTVKWPCLSAQPMLWILCVVNRVTNCSSFPGLKRFPRTEDFQSLHQNSPGLTRRVHHLNGKASS